MPNPASRAKNGRRGAAALASPPSLEPPSVSGIRVADSKDKGDRAYAGAAIQCLKPEARCLTKRERSEGDRAKRVMPDGRRREPREGSVAEGDHTERSAVQAAKLPTSGVETAGPTGFGNQDQL